MGPVPINSSSSAGAGRLSVTQFLIALIFLLVTVPVMEVLRYGLLIEAMVLTIVLLAGVVAVGGRRRTLITAVVLVTPALASKWLEHFWPDQVPREVTLSAVIVFVTFITFHLFRFILTAPRVTTEVLNAAMSVYLLLALDWAFAYALTARLIPGAFAFPTATDGHPMLVAFPALYFSFCTLTTLGYGDVVPVASVARMLAMAESTAGVFFATIVIARLVALYTADRSSRTGED